MVDGVNGKIKIGGTNQSIDLEKLKGLKVNPENVSIFNGSIDINRDGNIDENDKIDKNGNNVVDDDEAEVLKQFLQDAAGEDKTISESDFEGAVQTLVQKFMTAIKNIATQQTAQTTSVEVHDTDTQQQTTSDQNQPERKMTVKPGWGNIRVAKEALKEQRIENPTQEQIKKAKEAIEDANPDQCKTWKAKYGSQFPVGTKYFYANAEIKVPDLRAVLGMSQAEEVEDVEDVGEVEEPTAPAETPSAQAPQPEQPQQSTCIIQNPTRQSENTNDCWLLSGTNSLLTTSWGRKALNDAIKKDTDGGYKITLKGANNKEIKVSKAELEEAKRSGSYAQGDDSMIALEIAINKYREEIHPRTQQEKELNGLAINWGEGYELFNLITGKNIHRSQKVIQMGLTHPDYVEKGTFDVSKALDKMKENPDEIAMVASFTKPSDPFGKINIDGVELSQKHLYAVVGVETDADGKDYVILTNPRNSGEKIKISKESFLDYVDVVDALAEHDDTIETVADTGPRIEFIPREEVPE